MKSPLVGGKLVVFDALNSTQTLASADVRAGGDYGVVQAIDQTEGRGRHGRIWLSTSGKSLTMSMVFRAYAGHPRPHLVGMAVAIAAARAVGASVQWPNDIVIEGKKVGGILTDVVESIPVVGVGINVLQACFPPEIAGRATSLFLNRGFEHSVDHVRDSILAELAKVPEPDEWASLAQAWQELDETRGKTFMTNERQACVAVGVGPHGELIACLDHQEVHLYAAEAIFGD